MPRVEAPLEPAELGDLLRRLRQAPQVTVVVPVFNGGTAVARCLDALVRHTPGARLVVIDDASTETGVLDLLDARRLEGTLQIVRHQANQGYTRTANHAMELAGSDDLVLLNSDTEVGPRWLQQLRWVAYSRDDVATVSAVSDNAGAMSVPETGRANAWPEHLHWDEIARAAARGSRTWSVHTPTGHGFCLYLTRAARRKVGAFDVEAFPAGYGEENDWSMAARAAGLQNLVAPRVMVRHARSASFGDRRAALVGAGRKVVDARHPRYTADVAAWLNGPDMDAVRAEAAATRATLASTSRVLPVRLYVIHRSGGGTPATNRDLMSELAGDQESWLLEALPGGSGAELSRFDGEELHRQERFTPSRRFAVTDTWHQEYAEFLARVLIERGVELVHIRHLINQPLTVLPQVAAALGIPYVLSTHDFYYVCPTVHLLDERDRFCGGVCTPGAGTCRRPMAFVVDTPVLKHEWIHEWKRRSAEVMAGAAAVVATTRNAADVYVDVFGSLLPPGTLDRLHVIQHGRELDGAQWAPLRPDGVRAPGPLRIMAPANWAAQKGVAFARELARRVGPAVEWHVLGARGDALGDAGIVHGGYGREGLRRFAAEIDPDVVGLFSIWAETYSHTLTEAWALGLPVVATDIGAVAERVREHGGGVLVPLDDLDRAAEVVLTLAHDVAGVASMTGPVPRDRVRSSLTMAQDYRTLYERAGRAGPPPPAVGYVGGGSRLTSRIRHRTVSMLALWRAAVPSDLVTGTDATPYASMVLAHDAVPGHLVDDLVAALRSRGVRIVVDVCTDPISGRDPAQASATLRLLSAADVVTVSSPTLAEIVHPHAGEVVEVADPPGTSWDGAAAWAALVLDIST